MLGLPFLSPLRKDLTEDELRAYALEIVPEEYRTQKKFADYVLDKVREEYSKLSSQQIKELERENPNLVGLEKSLKSGNIPKKHLYEFAKQRVIEDYLPLLKDEALLTALEKSYKNMTGEKRPPAHPKKPNLVGGRVLEKLLDILRD